MFGSSRIARAALALTTVAALVAGTAACGSGSSNDVHAKHDAGFPV